MSDIKYKRIKRSIFYLCQCIEGIGQRDVDMLEAIFNGEHDDKILESEVEE